MGGVITTLGLILVISLIMFISGCTGDYEPNFHCDQRTIEINSISPGPGPEDYNELISFCVKSTLEDTATVNLEFNDGKHFSESMQLYDESTCMLYKIEEPILLDGVWVTVKFKDVKSIVVVSDSCPEIKDWVTNMSELGAKPLE